MKEIQLTQGYVTVVDDEDFDRLSQWSWCIGKDGYAIRSSRKDGKNHTIPMHRFLLDAPKGVLVDHINGNPLDNRKENLRLCNSIESNRNRKSTNPSGYKGVSLSYGKWRARLTVEKKKINLGSFENKMDAVSAYDKASIEYFGEFAKPNISPIQK